MEFNNSNSVWDLSLPQSLPSLADDEFIALLQKQFGVSSDALNSSLHLTTNKEPQAPVSNVVDPHDLTRFPSPQNPGTPPSEDDSPSPPSAAEASSSRTRRQSSIYAEGGGRRNDRTADDDAALKRKASEEDLDDEPDHKSQHTSSSKKNGAARRKSTGNSNPDESRLLKRKEQNRAAQRAFRERKEKHVKDLEDKVAALEEKNNVAVAENESLREVISRLQNENVRLRQTSFTFSVPSSSTEGQAQSSSKVTPPEPRQDSSMALFNNSPPSASSSTTASTHDSPQSLFINDQNDGNLSFFGQGLTVMDPEPQQTATSSADSMGMTFGFSPIVNQPYTTIASNPMFMSFREPDPYNPFPQGGQINGAGAMGAQPFDFSQLNYSSWPDVNMDDITGNNMQAFDLTNSLDELFGGASYLGTPGFDYGKPSPNSLSPVSHQNVPSPASLRSSSSSSASSSTTPGTSNSSSPAISDAQPSGSGGCNGDSCSKKNLKEFIQQDPGSMFVSSNSNSSLPSASSSEETLPGERTVSGDACPEAVPCKGLILPKTQRNDQNVEVMSAWRAIRHDPKYQSQDVDINQLCSEFASKAKCDGCQVVIEPSGMQEILETVTKSKISKQQGLSGAGNNTSTKSISSVIAN